MLIYLQHLLLLLVQRYKSGLIHHLLGKYAPKLLEELYSHLPNEQKKQSSELTKIFVEQYKELEFKSATKQSFEVNGKEHSCKGYQTTITEDDIQNLLDELEDYTRDPGFLSPERNWMDEIIGRRTFKFIVFTF